MVISAYKDQAITAFEYGVLDFVPKPFNRGRLEYAFDRVIKKEKTKNNKIKLLAIKKRGRIQLIPIEDIVYIKGAGAYTELFLADGKKSCMINRSKSWNNSYHIPLNASINHTWSRCTK